MAAASLRQQPHMESRRVESVGGDQNRWPGTLIVSQG